MLHARACLCRSVGGLASVRAGCRGAYPPISAWLTVWSVVRTQFDLIQDNLKYFLEIIQNKKSDFLEYMIVILIAAEILVSLFDMWTRDAFSGF